ncbi:hypothetical protein FRX31_010303 [Thalictrum thalictroides]|uniref:Reverse transcriptase zinc-binding domain-containing protein n=1 Tax=Thalictrum thalictroides TaxID=46969 RepID=A0A7J6WRU4_THATH|nr:hypothetical protein FRX31_010303 [Thalictrum thalictroides]
MRSAAVKFIQYAIGEGNISFWNEPWSQLGILRDKFNRNSRHHTGIRDNIKLSSFIIDRRLHFPNFNDPVLQTALSGTILASSGKDKLIWTPHPKGHFTIKTAYEVTRRRKEEKPWAKMVWGKHIRPRHSFVLWQAMQYALPTQDKIVDWKKLNIANCALCCNGSISGCRYVSNNTQTKSQNSPLPFYLQQCSFQPC